VGSLWEFRFVQASTCYSTRPFRVDVVLYLGRVFRLEPLRIQREKVFQLAVLLVTDTPFLLYTPTIDMNVFKRPRSTMFVFNGDSPYKRPDGNLTDRERMTTYSIGDE